MSTMETIDNEVGGAVKLELLATACTSGTCPTIFKSDRGTYVVQGYAVDAGRAGVTLGAGELLVEIPADLLAAIRDSAN